jgi:curli biogenesis system outer membrane secretion channel CsgG
MTVRYGLVGALIVALQFGCATQTPPVTSVEAPQSIAAQRKAQEGTVKVPVGPPVLKRKVALGRVTNETAYGRTLLRDANNDPLGKQVGDLFSKALVESGQFIVMERSDIGRLQQEVELVGGKLNLVGVDALIFGSLTEFGRKVVGETGFLSQTKKQVAFAKVDVRVVDAATGLVQFAVAGAGEASTESGSIAGFGSQAAYDGTLNDASIRIAVNEAVAKLTRELTARPWQTSIVAVEQGQVFISGGRSQGLRPGMTFVVETRGKRVKSPQTGFDIVLPGKEVARVQVLRSFGDNETSEASEVTVVTGSVQGLALADLVVVQREGP